jgi:hypothetical protein
MLACTAFAVVLLGGGCAHDAAGAPAAAADDAGAPAAATPLATRPVAVRLVEAPGFFIDDLTARLRDAVALTSGAPVVDEVGVRNELGACTEAPCPDKIGAQFRDAKYVVASSVSRVGDSFIAAVRIQESVEEIARENAEARDARVAITAAGRAAGAKLRARLLAEGALPANEVAPSDTGSASEGTEKSE